MSLKCGIVGLPNVGKSTLFNALTKAGIAAENYPFCTIEPNVGVVEVPDARPEGARRKSSSRSASCRPSWNSSTSPVWWRAQAGRRSRQPVPRQHPRNGRDHARRALLRRRERDSRREQDRSARRTSRSSTPNSRWPTSATVEKALARYSKAAKSGNDKEAIKNAAVLEKVRAQLDQAKPVRALDLVGRREGDA